MDLVNRQKCCRLCLCSTATVVDVFKEDSQGFSVKEAIKDLIQIEVKEETGLCWFICPTCLVNLGNFRLFKLQCQESNDAYTYRFRPHGNTQEYFCLHENISVKVEESNHDKTYDQNNPVETRGEIGVKNLSCFPPNEGSHEEVISDGTTKFKTEVEDIEETPECTTDNVDWPVNLEGEYSSDHGENIDIEEMDISKIKGENAEFVQTDRPGESSLLNESDMKNNKQRESDMLGFSETTPLQMPMDKVGREMEGKECSYSVESNEEGIKEGHSLPSEEERIHHSDGTGKHVKEDLCHLLVANKTPGDREKAMTTRRMRRHCKNNNSIPDTVHSSEPFSVVDSSRKDYLKIQKNQSIVVMKNTLSATSLRKCVNNGIGKSLKGKQSLRNAPTHLITEESGTFYRGRLRPRKEIKNLYASHSSDEEIDESFTCDICRKGFCHKSRLKSHLMSHNAMTLCEVCGEKFNNKHLISEHVCKPQLEQSSLETSVQNHPRILSETSCLPTMCDSRKPFECGICGKGFYRCESLEEHIWTHTGSKEFACTTCDKRYSGRSGLLTHLDTVHGESSIMCKCKVCDKKFSISHFKRHQRSHWKDKRFKCIECGNRFTEKSRLKVHMRIHTGERPYKCMFCSKDFTQSSNLKSHLYVHSDGKSFPCPKCDQCFSHSRSLRRHLVNHEGLKPYQCKVCGRRFTENHQLKRHSEIHERRRKKQK